MEITTVKDAMDARFYSEGGLIGVWCYVPSALSDAIVEVWDKHNKHMRGTPPILYNNIRALVRDLWKWERFDLANALILEVMYIVDTER